MFKLPHQVIEEFVAFGKDLCSWQQVADFAEYKMLLEASGNDHTNTDKSVVPPPDERNLLISWYAVKAAAGFLQDIQYPFPASNPELALDIAFNVGMAKTFIVADLALLRMMAHETTEQKLLDKFRVLKAEVPALSMENVENLFDGLVPYKARQAAIRPELHQEIKAIFDGPAQ